MITISTDGSVIKADTYDKYDKGSGGWGAIFHEDNTEISGHVYNATNNQMELLAVIEALKCTPIRSRVRIRTDSKYVHDIIRNLNMIRSNFKLWEEFIEIDNLRRVDIEWIRGHSGDVHNERADKLANQQANLALQ